MERDADLGAVRPNVAYVYTIHHDNGFAPNPYGGYCTLACCKDAMRKSLVKNCILKKKGIEDSELLAEFIRFKQDKDREYGGFGEYVRSLGVYVIGVAGNELEQKVCYTPEGSLILYMMQVTDVLTFEEYWLDERFAGKKPDAKFFEEKSPKIARKNKLLDSEGVRGDNVYNTYGETIEETVQNAKVLPSFTSHVAMKTDSRQHLSGAFVLVSDIFVYYGDFSKMPDGGCAKDAEFIGGRYPKGQAGGTNLCPKRVHAPYGYSAEYPFPDGLQKFVVERVRRGGMICGAPISLKTQDGK